MKTENLKDENLLEKANNWFDEHETVFSSGALRALSIKYWISGYREAQNQQGCFTLGQVKKAIEMAREGDSWSNEYGGHFQPTYEVDYIIQSIQQE